MDLTLMNSTTYRVKTGCKELYVHLCTDSDGHLIRVLADMGKAGGCVKAHLHTYTTLITHMLKYEDRNNVIKALNACSGVKCQTGLNLCCVEGLNSLVLEKILAEVEKEHDE